MTEVQAIQELAQAIGKLEHTLDTGLFIISMILFCILLFKNCHGKN